uniref:tRNA-splicing ligase RtcB n=1 Tax=candidate division WOR-3 bacterium TaxID=2052148 RepID=A0A7C4YGR2_UNCW3
MKKIDNYRYLIPKEGNMYVPGLIFSSEKMIKHIEEEKTYEQVKNVAHLKGIQNYSFAMPDIHWGYGFPIGGVAAMDVEEGVISPGGVGYDINCGVRSIRTDLTYDDVKDRLKELLDRIYVNVPCGVGSEGKVKLKEKDINQVMMKGALWAVENGYGWKEDIERIEDNGRMEGASIEFISDKAIERGLPQLGSLGAGNHFIEIQIVEEVYDENIARKWKLFKDQVLIMIHSGSRGFGHQICSDYIHIIQDAMRKYGISVPDRELACVPIKSEEGKRYFASMASAANFAWANRQMIMHWIRESFQEVFKKSPESMGMELIYDVAHNIAKFEKHIVDGKEKMVCVHRKGATRAFPKGHPELPSFYRETGQPVIIPGDMGTHSYILVGTEIAMRETFGSTCHGAGRVLSRHQAIKITANRRITDELLKKGIIARAKSIQTLREEVPDAYKDIDDVIEVVHNVGLSKKVIKARPIGVVKG